MLHQNNGGMQKPGIAGRAAKRDQFAARIEQADRT